MERFLGRWAVQRRVATSCRAHIVPNGVDCRRITPRTDRPQGPPIIGALGELRQAKRVDRMLQALAAINAGRPAHSCSTP